MAKRTAEEMREYQRLRRAKQRTSDVANDAMTADRRIEEADEEIRRLKRKLSEARLSESDPVQRIANEAAAADKARKATKALREPSPNDYVEFVRSMTQDQRDMIISRMTKKER